MLPGAPDPPGWWRGRQPGPGLCCPSLLLLLIVFPTLLTGSEAQPGGATTEPGLNVYMSVEEVGRLIGSNVCGQHPL